MYVNYKLEIEDALIVITEIEYTPEQKQGQFQERIPEHVTVEGGYAMGFDGGDMDFDYFLEEYNFYIHDEALNQFKEETPL